MDNSKEYRYSLDEISVMLSKKLKPKRLLHSQNVATTAAAIAMNYGVEDLKPFMYAGLLHDCAKYLWDKEFIDYCQSNNIEMDEYELQLPHMLHGKVGADLAAKEYGITNPEILSAITHHTDGHENMTFLEKAIHLADHIEPLRDFEADPPLSEVRKLAFTDIDKAIYLIDNSIIKYLEGQGGIITPTSYVTVNYYKEKVFGENNE